MKKLLKFLVFSGSLLLMVACGKEAPKVFKDCADCPEMVAIPAGTFLMGSKGDPFASSPPSADEQPQHQVTIKSFAIGKYEVTQEQWYAVMGTLPSSLTKGYSLRGRTLPLDDEGWEGAQEFVKKLSAKTGKNYRLPSEAEWEYAARAGSQTAYSFGDDEKELGRFAWFVENSGGKTHPVGEKLPNAFGLHDMHGNAHEWTEDCWNESYSNAPTDGSAWTAGNCSMRVRRGGPYYLKSGDLRSAAHFTFPFRYISGGFRVARTD